MEIPSSTLITFFSLVAIALISRFAVPILRLLGWRKPSQRRRERQARRSLEKLLSIPEPGRKFAYLRKIDPFTFEEMILEAYKLNGHKIKRNHRYTGDGGIDGRVWLDDELHLIQAKRYSGHINASHVRDFCALVAGKGCKGIFVHTGKTGEASRSLANCDPAVSMISGQRLLELLDISRVKQ